MPVIKFGSVDLTKHPETTREDSPRSQDCFLAHVTQNASILEAIPREATLGDSHGNAGKILHFFMTEGMLNLSTEDYDAFWRIYKIDDRMTSASRAPYSGNEPEFQSQLTDTDLEDFRRIVSRIQKNNTKTAGRLIGDILAERGANDGLTLFVLNHLDHLEVPWEAIFSNHDFEFLNAVEPLLSEGSFQSFILDPEKFLNGKFIISRSHVGSVLRFLDLCKKGLVSFSTFKNLIQQYKKHLKMISMTEDINGSGITLFTHAPIALRDIQDWAELLGHKNREDLTGAVNTINQFFRKKITSPDAAQWLQKLKELIPNVNDPDLLENAKLILRLKEAYPVEENTLEQASLIYFAFSIWNRVDCFSTLNDGDRQVTYVYGHVGSGIDRLRNNSNPQFQNIDYAPFGKAPNSLIPGIYLVHSKPIAEIKQSNIRSYSLQPDDCSDDERAIKTEAPNIISRDAHFHGETLTANPSIQRSASDEYWFNELPSGDEGWPNGDSSDEESFDEEEPPRQVRFSAGSNEQMPPVATSSAAEPVTDVSKKKNFLIKPNIP